MADNIFAYTAPGCNYPEFVSVNIRDGKVVLTARAAAKADGACGDTVDVDLPPQVVREMARKLFGFACTTNA